MKIKILKKCEISKLTKFTYEIYKKKFNNSPSKEDYFFMEMKDKKAAERGYAIAAYNNSNQMIGGVIISRYSEGEIPTEYLYKVDLKKFMKENNLHPLNAWHISRLTISDKRLSLLSFMKLSIELASIGSERPFFFHECDKWLINHLEKKYGWNTRIIGEGKMDLGTVSYPLYISSNELINFYKKIK